MREIPDIIKNKVEIIKMKELWDKKTTEEQERILIAFGINFKELENLRAKRVILLTQPLSEDGYISEEKKIEIYKKYLEGYINSDIIIKKHPREKTNYKKYLEGVEEFNSNIPSEFFYLLDIKFDVAITLFSSGLNNLEVKKRKEFFGTEDYKCLIENFGIHKRWEIRNGS